MKQQDFYNTITQKHLVLPYYNELYLKHDCFKLYTLKERKRNNFDIPCNVALFPSYLTPKFHVENGLKTIIIPQKKITGYSILINENTNDIDSFLKSTYKKSFRSNILRFVNRFENCFEVNYKMFFGEISKEDYNFLMEKLHTMLSKRFNQRNDTNKVLLNWDNYLKTTYDLINTKKASLFVIYNKQQPVHICINHHYNKILFVSVPSFDLDYFKFALGNISLYKLLEWCINNNYTVMDMAYGYLEYKRRWSNNIYSYNHHIIYNESKIGNKISAKIEVKKLELKNFLKDKNVDDILKKVKKLLKKNNSKPQSSYSFESITNFTPLNNSPLSDSELQYLKRPINDYLFNNKEHQKKLKVYEIIKDKEYMLLGERNIQKLTILNHVGKI
ncbi:GNAT family N-acetyltransferase [Seonamhaeicola sp. NFXS20]|uniref:GNAT family N-acetyltransferase n=1 Tax=Seonamhaeicola sp. NFXS20 TaxID=2816959 RepID=UPI003B8B7966